MNREANFANSAIATYVASRLPLLCVGTICCIAQMMNATYISLISVGLLIITALSLYALRLTRQVREHEQKLEEEAASAASKMRTRQLESIQDIHFLCRSVLSDQCDITEGILRLHYALNSLHPELWFTEQLNSVRNHHQATSDMPILDAYKKLNPKQQFEIDKTRWQLEEQNKNSIHKELAWLSHYEFPEITRTQ